MIRVYVRDENEGVGALLGEFTPAEVLELPKLFEKFKTGADDGLAHFETAQFITDVVGAYFEIVVSSE